jgi:hypothetical protein
VCASRAEMVRVTGPLASLASGFRGYLAGLGCRSGYGLVGVMDELSAWMAAVGIETVGFHCGDCRKDYRIDGVSETQLPDNAGRRSASCIRSAAESLPSGFRPIS